PQVIERLHGDIRRNTFNGGTLVAWLEKMPDLLKYDEDERDAVKTIFGFLDQAGGPPVTEALHAWMPSVSKYSFRNVQLTGV
ncbi:MAG: hypothetical protein ACRENU_10480, partial [Gemmatimonadaceae bacterium]